MTVAVPGPELDGLLELLRQTRGFDFGAYKRGTLLRRLDKRLSALGLASVGEYADYLEVHPEEFARLFDMILINVTAFFRDPQVWDHLRENVVPDVIEAAGDGMIRVWSAGCSSGEEAYTLAMVFAEALGEQGLRERVKIYATDVDEEALAQARQGVYPERAVQGVPPDLLEKYFEPVNTRFAFRPDLRRSVVFGRQDLTRDAPISRVDLLCCRNTLMYFNAEAQQAILRRLHFALKPRGVLLLGKAEMLLSRGGLFEPIATTHRIFSKVDSGHPAQLFQHVQGPAAEGERPASRTLDLQDKAFQASSVPQLLLDAERTVVALNDRARVMFDLGTRDIGRALQDLELSYRPTDLRGPVEQACREQRGVRLTDVAWPAVDGETRGLDIEVTPLLDRQKLVGVAIAFRDVTRESALKSELKRAAEELETTVEELYATNEELETTNEELQSTNEELETTNEELQSTNEELETANEELRATNDELETMNDELRLRTNEVDVANAVLNAVLDNLTFAVVLLGDDGRVRTWNEVAEHMWGLRAHETIGKRFTELDSGLPVDEIDSAVRGATRTGAPTTLSLPAVTRRGQHVTANVTCTPLTLAPHTEMLVLVAVDVG